MPRRKAKTDDNQKAIVDTFRSMGISTAITSNAGDGFTDLVIGYGGLTVLVEVKDGNKPPSAQKLTPDQQKFHGSFLGAITTINSVDKAILLGNRLRTLAAHVNADWNV